MTRTKFDHKKTQKLQEKLNSFSSRQLPSVTEIWLLRRYIFRPT